MMAGADALIDDQHIIKHFSDHVFFRENAARAIPAGWGDFLIVLTAEGIEPIRSLKVRGGKRINQPPRLAITKIACNFPR